jgi:catechol 2,3-dioxygenase-like lactoylglutathione lyase family enzyme
MADDPGHGLTALDHVNIRTGRVDALAAFYCEVLGLSRGPRPPFPFGGAWLYCGGKPVVHLVDAGGAAPASFDPNELGLSHFAFAGTGMAAFLARLRQASVPYQVGRLPGLPVVQINLRDLDGNALHVDFRDADADAGADAGGETPP